MTLQVATLPPVQTVPWWITEPLKPRHHSSRSCSPPDGGVPPPGFKVHISHAVQPTVHYKVSTCSPTCKASPLLKTFHTHRTACVEILATSLQTRNSVPVTTAEGSYKLHTFLSPTNNHADSNLRDLRGHNPRIINRAPKISRAATKVTDRQ